MGRTSRESANKDEYTPVTFSANEFPLSLFCSGSNNSMRAFGVNVLFGIDFVPLSGDFESVLVHHSLKLLLVATAYKRKAEKVRPVDTPLRDGSSPAGDPNWR